MKNTDADLLLSLPYRGMQSGNSLEILFEKCEKYGIKVFLAPLPTMSGTVWTTAG